LQAVLIIAALSLVTAQMAMAQSPNRALAQDANRIVVLVNSDPITTADLRARMARIDNSGNTRLPPRQVLERQVLEQLIVERTQIQWAQEIGIKVDDATIREAEANIAAQNNVSVAQLHARLADMGSTMSAFRQNLRDEITLQRVREREVNNRVRVTEVDIDSYLREHSAATNPAETAHKATTTRDNIIATTDILRHLFKRDNDAPRLFAEQFADVLTEHGWNDPLTAAHYDEEFSNLQIAHDEMKEQLAELTA
jgi:parvulin-like peptidyl-prolyl isomerase